MANTNFIFIQTDLRERVGSAPPPSPHPPGLFLLYYVKATGLKICIEYNDRKYAIRDNNDQKKINTYVSNTYIHICTYYNKMFVALFVRPHIMSFLKLCLLYNLKRRRY